MLASKCPGSALGNSREISETAPEQTRASVPVFRGNQVRGNLDTQGNQDIQSAGINRHEVENERVLQERNSEPS
jgi:hypothetical protein